MYSRIWNYRARCHQRQHQSGKGRNRSVAGFVSTQSRQNITFTPFMHTRMKFIISLCMFALAFAVPPVRSPQPVNFNVIDSVIFLLDITIANSSTITIGNDYGISELKGSLNPGSDENDLILDTSFAQTGWVTIYHLMAPYLEHNSHIHFHANMVTYANAVASDSFAVLNFWPSKAAAMNNSFGVLCVFFPSWFDYTKNPPQFIPENKEYFANWTSVYGMEWDLTKGTLKK
jgi:hypothetical protein